MIITKLELPDYEVKVAKKNYKNIQLNLDAYDEKMQDTVFLKFVKILKSKRIDVIANVNHIIQVNNKHKNIFKEEYSIFKSKCLRLRKWAKIDCTCDDKHACRILECSCCCHEEEKFFNDGYRLKNIDKIGQSLQHFGPKELITKSLVHNLGTRMDQKYKNHLCHICRTYNNPKCGDCELIIKFTI